MRLSEKSCTIGGREISFLEAGSGKQTLLFLHGYPMNKSLWRSQVEALSTRYHCLAPDITGYGDSVAPAGYEATIKRYAKEMAKFLKGRANGPAIVFGLSMGGMIALSLVKKHPELICGLGLLHTFAGADNDEAKEVRNQTIEAILTEGREAFARRFASKYMAPDTPALARAEFMTMIESARYETMVSGMEAIRDRPDRTGLLSDIMVPSIVIAGEHDSHSTPDLMKSMADALVNSKFVTLDGIAHISPLESPDMLNVTLESWLDTTFKNE